MILPDLLTNLKIVFCGTPQEISLPNARHTMPVPATCFIQPWQVVALHPVS